MNEDSARHVEELTRTIENLLFNTKQMKGDCYYTEAIVTFILEDRRRIVKQGIVIGYNIHANNYEYGNPQKVLDETLKNAGVQ